MKLGKCIKLNELTPNIMLSAGASSSWVASDAAHATWTADLPPGRDCGGDPDATGGPSARCDIKLTGCGKIKVTCEGTSGDTFDAPVATATLLKPDDSISSQPYLQKVGSDGGEACYSVPLTGDEEVTFNVACGWTLQLYFDAGYIYTTPASEAVFTVEILP